MKVKLLLFALSMMVLSVLLVACAKAPQQEIEAAKAALEAAKTAEADRYAADLYNAAKDSLDAALAEVEAQNAKFALTRNFDKAQKWLQSAITAANAAKEAVAANKEQIRAEAQDLWNQAKAAVAEVKALMAKAPKGKEGKQVLEQMQSEISGVEASLAEAETALNNGDFLTARDKAKAGLEKATALKDELNQAISKKAALSK
ncbi:MAG: DUF4398 domain-containing protein [candidate division KSB1 bacterium]|nr:DUF4398 domain-containing protein [candidate division KSB1 bacterium]